MASAVIKFSAILLLVAVVAADVSHFQGSVERMTDVCLGCICQAVSECSLRIQCEGDQCGPFHIPWSYWADAGKPTLDEVSPDSPEAFPSCTNDPYCAADTVKSYMNKFAQDCNSDGRIDCYDYMAIHKKGRYGCVGELPFGYVNVFNQCIFDVARSNITGAWV